MNICKMALSCAPGPEPRQPLLPLQDAECIECTCIVVNGSWDDYTSADDATPVSVS